jgi:raffinose/stachyose/melibiose transport system permease protein
MNAIKTSTTLARVGELAPSNAKVKKKRTKRGPAAWVVLVAMGLFAVAIILPVLLALMNSVKSTAEYTQDGPLALPQGIDLTNIIAFWETIDFSQKLWNSLVISTGATVLGLILSVLTAYAIGIGRIRGRFWILALFMVAFTLPQEALIYPLYTMAKSVGLYNSQWSVIIVVGVLQSAFGAYLLSSVMTTFPEEILEAAKLDGAGRFRILISVVLPLLRPSILVLATFFFIWTWNEFFIPLVLLPSGDTQTVSVALGALFGQYTSNPVTSAAAATVGILPALVFFLLFQRTLMKGVNIGAIK